MTDLVIRNVDDLMRLTQLVAVSNLLPDKLRGKPADVGVILMYGAELGMSPVQALQGIYVVDGRPSLAAQTWLALARRAGHSIKVTEHTTDTCSVRIVRGDGGDEHTSTYTLAEAKVAGLVAKKNWQQNPKAMLLARAVSAGCRFACPEIALGFYAEGELDDVADTIVAAADVIRQEQATEPEPEEPVDAEVIQGELADIAAGYTETRAADVVND